MQEKTLVDNRSINIPFTLYTASTSAIVLPGVVSMPYPGRICVVSVSCQHREANIFLKSIRCPLSDQEYYVVVKRNK